MNFGAIVKKYRVDYSVSQEATAKLLDISRNYLSLIERGQANDISWKIGNKILDLPRLKNAAIKEDPDCCEAWPQIASYFSWLSVTESPDMLTTPYIVGEMDDRQWIVNFCPLCGANARNRMMRMQRIDA